jgi:hypothetical protein
MILFYTSCSSNDDKDEPCEDKYWLKFHYDCDDRLSWSFVKLSLNEGERIKNIIESTKELCFAINGTTDLGKSFEGFIITSIDGGLTYIDCDQDCYLCPF